MNKVIQIGRIVREIELRYSPSGTAVATFTIAVNRDRTNSKGEREADFLPCVVFQKQAENCANYLTKGSQICIEGRLQTRNYDAKDGTKRYVTEIIGERVQFLDSRSDQKSEPIGEEVDKDDECPF